MLKRHRQCVPLLLAVLTVPLLLGACSDDADVASASDSVKKFDKFALVWPGEEWDQDEDGSTDTPVTSAGEFRTPDGRFSQETHGFEMVYGRCHIAEGQSEGGCPVPLYVVVYPPCETPPLAEEAKVRKVKIRGVDADITAGAAVWIETEEFTVQITHAAPRNPGDSEDHVAKAIKLAAKLEGANDKAKHITKDSTFKVKPKGLCEKDKTKASDATATAQASRAAPDGRAEQASVTPAATPTP